MRCEIKSLKIKVVNSKAACPKFALDGKTKNPHNPPDFRQSVNI